MDPVSICQVESSSGRTMSDSNAEKIQTIRPRKLYFLIQTSKLNRIPRLMALIGGFCIASVAQLDGYNDLEPWLVTVFIVITIVLASMSSFVLLLINWILPYLSANEELDTYLIENQLDHPLRSHRYYYLDRQFEVLMQLAWILASTGTVSLFVLDMCLIMWIKFHRSTIIGPAASTTIITPTFFLMIYFALRFWKELLRRKVFGTYIKYYNDYYKENILMSHRSDPQLHQLTHNDITFDSNGEKSVRNPFLVRIASILDGFSRLEGSPMDLTTDDDEIDELELSRDQHLSLPINDNLPRNFLASSREVLEHV